MEQMDLIKAELGLRQAKTVEAFLWSLARYADIYMELFAETDGNYPAVSDLQRRYNYLVKPLAGHRSVLRLVQESLIDLGDRSPVELLRQGENGKTLVAPTDYFDSHNGTQPVNDSASGEKFDTVEVTGITQDS